jgi:hypothetical protein
MQVQQKSCPHEAPHHPSSSMARILAHATQKPSSVFDAGSIFIVSMV